MLADLTFVSVFAVNMVASYKLSTVDIGYAPTDVVTMIEANTTSHVNVLKVGGIFTANACGKFDFQLYSFSPVMPNGVRAYGHLAVIAILFHELVIMIVASSRDCDCRIIT